MNGRFTAQEAAYLTVDELTHYLAVGLVDIDNDTLARALTHHQGLQRELLAEAEHDRDMAQEELQEREAELEKANERWARLVGEWP